MKKLTLFGIAAGALAIATFSAGSDAFANGQPEVCNTSVQYYLDQGFPPDVAARLAKQDERDCAEARYDPPFPNGSLPRTGTRGGGSRIPGN